MMLSPKFVLLSGAAWLVLLACTGRNSDEMDRAVPEEQQRIAIETAEQVRTLVNQGACDVVYAQARAYFRSQTLPDWVAECEELRRLGPWQSFSARRSIRCGSDGAVCLDGTAIFGNQRYGIEIGWRFEKGLPRLLDLSMGRNAKDRRTIPPLPNNLMDPPATTDVDRRG